MALPLCIVFMVINQMCHYLMISINGLSFNYPSYTMFKLYLHHTERSKRINVKIMRSPSAYCLPSILFLSIKVLNE